jgi:hypothetical protein
MPIPEAEAIGTVRELMRAAAHQMRSEAGTQCPLDVALTDVRRDGDERMVGIGFAWNVHDNQVKCFLIDITKANVK